MLNDSDSDRVAHANATQHHLNKQEVQRGEQFKEHHVHVREGFASDDQWIVHDRRFHQIHVV